ncbi:MAG: hypothetical protein JXA90_15570, partial [Planctomycetes bacterium]|nr:hypothetical protein [Planctomycetota bacterium]
DDDKKVILIESGRSAADFQSIADYLADPTVQVILDYVPRHNGPQAPDVRGTFEATGQVVATSIPGGRVGDAFRTFFCTGQRSGSRLEVKILDPTVEDAGAASFIEGSGDSFTIYTAFRSVQLLDTGEYCEIHEVDVISGRLEADGSLSDLFIGQGVVGLLGDCGNLLAGDIQVGQTTAELIGGPCEETPGSCDPTSVELTVENALLSPILVLLDSPSIAGPQPFLVDPGELSQPMYVPQGFSLVFESLQPACFDIDAFEVLQGEIVAGFFAADTTGPGGSVTYLIENQVGDEIYYAPLPLNQTADSLYTLVNEGVEYQVPPVGALGILSLCSLDPNIDPYFIGYYSYSVPGFIEPAQTNVTFFRLGDDAEVERYDEPAPLELGTGAVTLPIPRIEMP